MGLTRSSGAASRSTVLLIFGAMAGLLAALASILEPAPRSASVLPANAAAIVNGVPILRDEFEKAVAALASDREEPITKEDTDFVLNRLIEQELLVQRAKELGLDREDRMIRNVLVSAVVQYIIANVDDLEFGDAEVRAFYDENAAFFARTGRASIRHLRVPVNGEFSEEQSQERAEAAVARLRLGEPFWMIAAELGAPEIAPLPQGFLPEAQVRNYIGPTPAREAFTLQPGEVSDAIRGGSAYHVIQMIDREPGAVPALDTIRDLVIHEMHRRAGDRALREYLDTLAAQADIRKAE